MNRMDDLKISLRQLRRSPGFTVASIAVLALGIGLNAAMFSVVHALAFAARPFAQPERLVQLYSRDVRPTGGYRAFSYALYQDLAARTDLFDGLLAHHLTIVGVGEGASVRRTLAGLVSANYFDVLGVRMLHGRGFTADEARHASDIPVAVVTHAYWQRAGFDPRLLGQTLRLNGRPFTVVGIAPRGFSGTMSVFGPDLFLPLGVSDAVASVRPGETARPLGAPDVFRLSVIGRLKADVSPMTINEALRLHGESLGQALPADYQSYELSATLLPRFGVGTSPQNDAVISTLAITLLGMTGAVLLTVCLNLASMLFARGRARRQEIAIRLALGARRSAVIRQLLIEGLLLSLAGGVVGVALGRFGIERILTTISALLPITLVFDNEATLALVVATAVCCLVATLSFALGPALKHSRTDIVGDLKAQTGDDPAPRKWLLVPRNPLVAAQIAISLSLLIAAGLFMRMALGGAFADLGFRADDTVIAEVDSKLGGFDDARSLDLYNHLETRLAEIPGVQTASIGALAPLGVTQISRPVQRAGVRPAADVEPSTPEQGRRYYTPWNAIGSGYFEALGIRLLQGRAFTAAETFGRGASAVAIIDETLARRLWPEGDALGQRVQWAIGANAPAEATPPMVVVGIVSIAQRELFENVPRGAIYVPFAQGFTANVYFFVRPAVATPALVDAVRRTLREAAPALPLFSVRTFATHRAESPEYWALTRSAAMFASFGGLAMLIASVGIYGVTAYMVARRRREIGVRIAIGARPAAVLRLIMQDSLETTLAGIVLGWLLGLGVGQVMDSMFVDVEAFDAWTFSLVPAGFVLAALAATWLPARRATGVNPVTTLRSE